MKLMIDLFSTDYGLMSLAVILLIIVMAAFFTRLFLGKMKNVASTPLSKSKLHSTLRMYCLGLLAIWCGSSKKAGAFTPAFS
jgi:spore maturation protein SpmA